MRTLLSVFAFVVAFLALGWVIQGDDYFLYRTFAPKYEQVRRETFEQTKSYNQGMVQELQNMQFQYVGADSAHQTALATIILHRAADYDLNKLPVDLRNFIHSDTVSPQYIEERINVFTYRLPASQVQTDKAIGK